jgi:hypothetical protein
MPHINIIFNPDVVSGNLLFSTAHPLTEIVAGYFEKTPQQVTFEARPSTQWTVKRKDIDIEISCNNDPQGKRAKVSQALAAKVGAWLREFLTEHSLHCEISVWVQIFGEGAYSTF